MLRNNSPSALFWRRCYSEKWIRRERLSRIIRAHLEHYKVQYCCVCEHEEGIKGSEDTAPHTDRFNPEVSAPATHWIGRWVGPEPSALRSGKNSTVRHKVHRGLSAGTILIFAIFRVSFSTSLVPQLQLWHPTWSVCVQSVGDLHSPVPNVLQFLSHGDVVIIVDKHYHLDDVVQNPIPRISVH